MLPRFLLLMLAALPLALSGCGGSREGFAPPAAPAPTAAASGAAATKTPSPPGEKPDTAVTPAAEYRPPFPGRTNLFAPSQQQRPTRSVTERDSGDSVVLKGFAKVDGTRAVLSINGQITPLAEGSERHGVRVISIHPPEVVLQRGRTRWTASLR